MGAGGRGDGHRLRREPRPRHTSGPGGPGPGDGPARRRTDGARISTTACPTSCRSASSTGSTTAWCRSAATPPWPWRPSRSRAAPRATGPVLSNGAGIWRRSTRWPALPMASPSASIWAPIYLLLTTGILGARIRTTSGRPSGLRGTVAGASQPGLGRRLRGREWGVGLRGRAASALPGREPVPQDGKRGESGLSARITLSCWMTAAVSVVEWPMAHRSGRSPAIVSCGVPRRRRRCASWASRRRRLRPRSVRCARRSGACPGWCGRPCAAGRPVPARRGRSRKGRGRGSPSPPSGREGRGRLWGDCQCGRGRERSACDARHMGAPELGRWVARLLNRYGAIRPTPYDVIGRRG